MSKHKWYLPLAAAAVTALSLTGVSLADDHRSDAPVSASAKSSGGHNAKRSAGRARASAFGGVNVTIVKERFILPAGSYIDKTATCPGGTSAVGGGFDGTADNAWKDFMYMDSFPSRNNGWTVRVGNKGSTEAHEVYAVVTCAN